MKEQSDTPSWWRCDTHGPGTRTAWGCPECVRELRTSLATATRERDEARAEVERMRSAFVHCHVRGSSGDLCAVCGLDLRDKVHTAATEAKPWAR